jgi:general secretion pathway protein H
VYSLRRNAKKLQLGPEHGFTLIEILVVVAIIGVVMGVLIGRGQVRSHGLETRAAAGALAQGLRAARAQAIATDHDVTMVIDPGRHVFAADNNPVRQIDFATPMVVRPPAIMGPGLIGKITFSPDGSSTGGDILLGVGHRRLDVSVEWLTGKVSVDDAK